MAVSRSKTLGRIAVLARNGFAACRCQDRVTRGRVRARKRQEAREVAVEANDELAARDAELGRWVRDGRAVHDPCAHCGRDPAAGYATAGGTVVCHPHDPALPDCYVRTTVWRENLGALRGRDPMPAGLDAISDAVDAFLSMVALSEELDLYDD